MIPRTLNGKIAVALFALLALISLAYLALTVIATQLYQQEVSQKLNLALARHIVAETPLLNGGEVNHAELKHLFHTLMVVNPSIELYLTDAAGEILAFDAPREKVKRNTIDLGPVRHFIGGGGELPIRGDDPRDADREKVFSAAPVYENGVLTGYLYIVLGGEDYDGVAQMIRDSFILRLTVGVAVVTFLLCLAGGLLSFFWLTARLRNLSGEVDAFKDGELRSQISLPRFRHDGRGDEIDSLGVAFEQMSGRIVDQVRQLRHADAMRREMITNISHDLRTPLTSLQGFLDTLLMKDEQLDDAQRRRYIELAAKHVKRLVQLTSELFELAMLESQGARPDYEKFSLSELVQDISQKFELSAQQKDIVIETDIPRQLPFVLADIALIERVLENFIENAIKYTQRGGRIKLSVSGGLVDVEVSVSDTGIGIPRDELPHLFERHYRVEKSAVREHHGTGLGLAIAHRILQLHSSAVSVESTLGEGSSFSFRLPVTT